MKMVYIGADHRGFKLKDKLKEIIRSWGYDLKDTGNQKYDPEDDYTDIGVKLGKQ